MTPKRAGSVTVKQEELGGKVTVEISGFDFEGVPKDEADFDAMVWALEQLQLKMRENMLARHPGSEGRSRH
jgi:hypothetical protein